MATSPYKKMKLANQKWVSYINIKLLVPNLGYQITGLVETNHDQYGKGQQAYITSHDGKKYRAQLPKKYLTESLSPESLAILKRDTINKKYPYLIYRETLPDNSYKIDIVEKSIANDETFRKGLPFPELEDSVEETFDEETKETSFTGKGGQDDCAEGLDSRKLSSGDGASVDNSGNLGDSPEDDAGGSD